MMTLQCPAMEVLIQKLGIGLLGLFELVYFYIHLNDLGFCCAC